MENAVGQSRFSFEISPSLPQHRSIRPFGEQRKSHVDTQVLSSIQKDSPEVVKFGDRTQEDTTVLAQEMNIDETESNGQKEESEIAATSRNPFAATDPKKMIGPSQSADIYNKGIAASAMFDANIPANESEAKIPAGNNNYSGIIPANQTGDKITYTNQRIDKVAQKRLYPGQVTLNHIVRKKEVQRINRENMVSSRVQLLTSCSSLPSRSCSKPSTMSNLRSSAPSTSTDSTRSKNSTNET